MDNICPIIQDILPLYAESLVSPESEQIINEHLHSCPRCREAAARVSAPAAIPDEAPLPLSALRRKLRRKKLLAAALGILAGLIAVICIVSALNTPEYFPYSDGIVDVRSSANGLILHSEENVDVQSAGDGLILFFSPGVSDFSISESREPESDLTIYTVEAWTSRWDSMKPDRNALSTVISDDSPFAVYYAQNNGREDICIYGEEHISGGMITLPALRMGYYVIIMAVLFIVLTLTAIVLRKKRAGVCLGIAALYPASYLLSHIVLGIGTVSYSFSRDFGLVLLCSVPIFILLLLARELIKCFR